MPIYIKTPKQCLVDIHRPIVLSRSLLSREVTLVLGQVALVPADAVPKTYEKTI